MGKKEGGEQKGKMDFSLAFYLLFYPKMILYWSQCPTTKSHKILISFGKDTEFGCLQSNDTKVGCLVANLSMS